MPTMLKQSQSEYIKSNVTESRALKCLYVDKLNNIKRKNSYKYWSEDGRYIFLLFCLQKESNRLIDLIDLGKKSRSLTYIICIPKMSYPIIANFVLVFLRKKSLKAQIKNLYLLPARGNRVTFSFSNFYNLQHNIFLPHN